MWIWGRAVWQTIPSSKSGGCGGHVSRPCPRTIRLRLLGTQSDIGVETIQRPMFLNTSRLSNGRLSVLATSSYTNNSTLTDNYSRCSGVKAEQLPGEYIGDAGKRPRRQRNY